ncbi:MAG: fumarate hydratase [Candidatus Omnitrophica bacterium]|nr:fumarate hydratase [Candidatus Omnitrophota bacterium]
MNKNKIDTRETEELIIDTVARAHFRMRPDVKRLLLDAARKERAAAPRRALEQILENARAARTDKVAMCQDTGLPLVFLETGRQECLSPRGIEVIRRAVARGYQRLALRPSWVDPFRRVSASYRGILWHWDVNPRIKKGMRITVCPKGFGSENKSRLVMLNPTAGRDEVEECVVEAVRDAGPESCPPFVVGIGIGGTADHALLLAKKVLLGRVDRGSTVSLFRTMEKRILEKINRLGIGPMGMGGAHTALAVKIMSADTHIAGLPVGINISCHALRSAGALITNTGGLTCAG